MVIGGGNLRNNYGMFKPHEGARLPWQKVPGSPRVFYWGRLAPSWEINGQESVS
jgi:hypothetical protein